MGKGPSVRSGTGREIVGEVLDWSGDPWGGPGRVGGLSGRSLTGSVTHGEVWDGPWTLEEV